MKNLTDARIVLAESASYNEKRNVTDMINEVRNATAKRMELVFDHKPEIDFEIVFGKTNRKGSAELYATLGHGSYAIVSKGNSVYVAYDNYVLAIDAIKKVGELCKEGATLPLNIVETPDYSNLHMDKANDEQIRVMTTNITAAGDLDSLHYLGEAYGVTYIDRVDIQASMILDLLPDFIGFQELQECRVNGVWGFMQTEMIKRIGHEYTMVDCSEYVLSRDEWTPIFYRHAKWELIEGGAATNAEIKNEMHRWQWGVYRNKENGQLFIHMNLHGPNSHYLDFIPAFYGKLVKEKMNALLEKYPNTPVAITGDYNQYYNDEPYLWFQQDTTLNTAFIVAKDTTFPDAYGDIDHISINTDVLEADTYRMINNGLIYMTSDHCPCFADLSLKK